MPSSRLGTGKRIALLSVILHSVIPKVYAAEENVTSSTIFALPKACPEKFQDIASPCSCTLADKFVIISCTETSLDSLLDLDQLPTLLTLWIKINLKGSPSIPANAWRDNFYKINHRVERLELASTDSLALPLDFINSAGSFASLKWLQVREGHFDSSKLPAKAFPNGNLETISVINCNLEEIDENAFTPNTNLIQLDLSANPLRFIPYSALMAMPKLEILTINYAYLKTLDPFPGAVISFPSALKAIHLDNNQISDVPDSFVAAIQALHPGLQSLRLGHNHIRHVQNSMFNLSSLTSLVLANNLISKIPKALKNARNFTDVDLSTNNLSVIDPRDIPSHLRKFFKPWNLRGNPFSCGYEMAWFVCWLKREKPTDDQLDGMACEGTNEPLLSYWNETLCRPKPLSIAKVKPPTAVRKLLSLYDKPNNKSIKLSFSLLLVFMLANASFCI